MGLRLRVRGGAPGRGLYMPLPMGGSNDQDAASNGQGRSGEGEGRWAAWAFGRPCLYWAEGRAAIGPAHIVFCLGLTLWAGWQPKH
jgi:hypothetical protein